MNSVRLTVLADASADRYRSTLMALSGIYAGILQGKEPGSPAAIYKAATESYKMADTYLSSEIPAAQEALETQALDAFTMTRLRLNIATTEPLPDDVREHIEGIADELDKSLRLQLERDISSMITALRSASLRAVVMARTRNVSRLTALNTIRSDTTAPAWNFMDRAGKKWSSSKYVRTAWRSALVLAWNETAMMTMSDYGIQKAVINHTDESHQYFGQEISLAEKDNLPVWETVKDEVFHPNTNAWLTPANE